MFEYYTIASVTITKSQILQMCRDKVLKLSSQGLMQQEMTSKLSCSQKTISNDLALLKKDADNSVKQLKAKQSFELRAKRPGLQQSIPSKNLHGAGNKSSNRI